MTSPSALNAFLTPPNTISPRRRRRLSTMDSNETDSIADEVHHAQHNSNLGNHPACQQLPVSEETAELTRLDHESKHTRDVSGGQVFQRRHSLRTTSLLSTKIDWRSVSWMVLLLCWCLDSASTGSTLMANAFLVPQPALSIPQRIPRHGIVSENLRYPSALASTTSSETDFQSLTVKELKQLVKDGPQPLERGILSKLKRKQDLIDYLLESHHEQPHHQEPEQRKNGAATKTEKATPMKMPSLESNSFVPALNGRVNGSSEANIGVSENDAKQPKTASNHLSRKDAIFEKVFERYPTIREEYHEAQEAEAALAAAATEDDDAENNEYMDSMLKDVRQIHHPIFQSIPSHVNSCDMDIVFVGTASCTPGITRGVSCTALRMNWNRRPIFQEPSTKNGKAVNDDTAATATPVNGVDDRNSASSFQGGTWLFDVGECTQLQVQRTPSIKPSKISKIFLTHAHGDHTFGLPGLLCLMGQDRDRSVGGAPIDIYGPEGLRKYLRVAIRYSVSRIVPPYRVHELKEVPMAPEWQYNARHSRYYYKGLPNSPVQNGRNQNQERPVKPWGTQGLAGEDPNSWITQSDQIQLAPSSQYGEVPGGRDIYPIYDHPLANDGAPVWEVEDEDEVKVYAAPMSHGIPCVGYVVEEASRPGRLRNELVQPMVMKNLDALKQAGLKIPMKALAVIKNLPVGSAFTFPDGSIITQEEAVEPPRKGRKVVIMGDTANCRSMEVLANDCDVLVHEATNAYLPGIDRDTNLRSVTRDAVFHGHSTPELAGLFAKKVDAKLLLMNHFSARYKGDPSVDSLSIMMRIENFAMKASGLSETKVAAAWDGMLFPIRSHE